MALVPSSLTTGDFLSRKLMEASRWVSGFFGGSAAQGFSSAYSLESMKLLDERLRPQGPMPAEDIEVLTRMNLGNMGLLNARRVTEQSHPELYSAWLTLSQRAGFGQKVPQLIVAESRMANAFELDSGEMVVTTGLLKMLDLRETVAVLGHEFGHHRHNHTAPRRSASLLFGGAGAVAGNYAAHYGWEALKTGKVPVEGTPHRASLLSYAVGIWGGMAIGNVAANHVSVKPGELQSDLDGVAISGDGAALASALRKLQAGSHRGPIKQFIGYLLSGYPTIDQRVANIERATAEIPPNPVPAVLGAAPQPKVSAVAHADRVQADIALERAF